MWETWVRSLGGEDALEKGMATCFIAREIPWTEEPGGLQSMGSQELDTTNTFKYTTANTAQMRLMAVCEPHMFTVWGGGHCTPRGATQGLHFGAE